MINLEATRKILVQSMMDLGKPLTAIGKSFKLPFLKRWRINRAKSNHNQKGYYSNNKKVNF